MKNVRILIGMMFFVASKLYAQQEAQITQYNDNMLYYNPAYAGSRDHMNIMALHRQQWIGFTGAPMTDCLSLHTPIKYESVGLGLSLMNDKVGPMNSTWCNASFSYSLEFQNKSKLAFGLDAGMNMLNARLNDLITADENDPTLMQNSNNRILPNFGGGLYYHTKHFYVGLSIPRVIESLPKAGKLSIEDQRHYYLSVGGYLDVNRMVQIRPSALLKVTSNAPVSLDGSLAFIFYKKLWIGLNYRLLESAGVLVQLQLSNQMKLGYSLDISTTRLAKYTGGTHEVILSYDLNFLKKKIQGPRGYYF